MNRSKAALVAGLAAIAVLAWVLLRGRGTPAAPAGASGSATIASGGVASGSAPASDDRMRTVRPPIHVGPSGVEPDLEPPPPAPGSDSSAPHLALANGFDVEPRDADFDDAHEHELDRRIAAIKAPDGVTVAPAECRGHQCRITFTAADDRALGRFVGQLEQPEGLNGYAQMIVLEAITDTRDGKRQERVYARFGD